MKKFLITFMLLMSVLFPSYSEIKGVYFSIDDPNIKEGSVEYYLCCIKQLIQLEQYTFATEYLRV